MEEVIRKSGRWRVESGEQPFTGRSQDPLPNKACSSSPLSSLLTPLTPRGNFKPDKSGEVNLLKEALLSV